MDPIPELFRGTFGIIAFVIAAIYTALVGAMPIVLYAILVELRKQTKLLNATDQTPLHQTKLLTEIRNALQSMQAVGIEETEIDPPSLPQIRNPSSVPPGRERLRH